MSRALASHAADPLRPEHLQLEAGSAGDPAGVMTVPGAAPAWRDLTLEEEAGLPDAIVVDEDGTRSPCSMRSARRSPRPRPRHRATSRSSTSRSTISSSPLRRPARS